MNFLYGFRTYRRLRGGRWEYWLHEEGYSLWYRWDSEIEKKRPQMNCRGTPTIEVYE